MKGAMVPRVLLKNGKRSRVLLQESRLKGSRDMRGACDDSCCEDSGGVGRVVSEANVACIESENQVFEGDGCADCRIFRASMIESINKLRADVSNLKEEVGKGVGGVSKCAERSSRFCWLFVGIGDKEFKVGKVQPGSLLGCLVVQYVRIEGSYMLSFKVKIMEEDLRKAIDNGRRSGCAVFLWRNSTGSATRDRLTDITPAGVPAVDGHGCGMLKIACWNCRGLGSSF